MTYAAREALSAYFVTAGWDDARVAEWDGGSEPQTFLNAGVEINELVCGYGVYFVFRLKRGANFILELVENLGMLDKRESYTR